MNNKSWKNNNMLLKESVDSNEKRYILVSATETLESFYKNRQNGLQSKAEKDKKDKDITNLFEKKEFNSIGEAKKAFEDVINKEKNLISKNDILNGENLEISYGWSIDNVNYSPKWEENSIKQKLVLRAKSHYFKYDVKGKGPGYADFYWIALIDIVE